MKRVLCRLFALHPDEAKKTFIFSVLAFCWSVAATLGLKYSDVVFLLNIGSESLPLIYQCVAFGLIFFSGAFLYAYHHFNGTSVFLGLNLIGISIYLFIYLCLTFNVGIESQWIWFISRGFAALFLYSMLATFWTFIDQYHRTSDAKKLFGLFTSIIFLGSTASGALLHSGVFSYRASLVIIILALISAICLIFYISNTERPVIEGPSSTSIAEVKSSFSLFGLFSSVLSSPYTRFIIAGNFFAFVLWVIAEYNYMSVFESRFVNHGAALLGSEQNSQLTEFLGRCVTITSIVNLLFGLFIYSRLVNYFGIGSVILLTPFLYLITFFGWIINDSILFPLMGFFIVEGTAEITEDSNTSILLKVGPTQLKSSVRVIIELFFEPLGMLTSGLLLSFPQVDSKWLGLSLATAALLIAIALRSNYFSTMSYGLEKRK